MTVGAAKALVEALAEAGALLVGPNDALLLANNWSERLIFVCGDAHLVDNGCNFLKKAKESIGRRSNCCQMSVSMRKALSQILWFLVIFTLSSTCVRQLASSGVLASFIVSRLLVWLKIQPNASSSPKLSFDSCLSRRARA